MSETSDLQRVINFLGEGLDVRPPQLRRNEPSPNGTSETIELGYVQSPNRAGINVNETNNPVSAVPSITSVERSDERRVVNRELKQYHTFFIALSGTLGVGLYVHGGAMLRLAGPVALISSFILLTALAWGVMQCIAEMLCIWPISGALHQFVEKFVDKEVGQAVGAAYWFTNAMGFGAVLSAVGSEVQIWTSESGSATDIGVRLIAMFLAVPIFLIWLNSLGVKVYGWTEVVGGILKSLFVVLIILFVYSFVFGAGDDPISTQKKLHTWQFDKEATSHYGNAFVMCLPLAAFAFVGVEITAATAVEASADTRSQTVPFAPLKWPATRLPLFVGGTYTFAAIAIALYVDSTSPKLPPQSWVNVEPRTEMRSYYSSSAFVQAAEASRIPHLASVFTVFLLVTAFSTANTLLYVASRTLYGLADASTNSTIMRWFGVTTRGKHVPLRAVFASAVFWLISPISYAIVETKGSDMAVTEVFNVLSNMTSVACIIVWAFECLAFLRFYFCIRKHRAKLNNETRLSPLLRRFPIGHMDVDVAGETANYPWRSHLQPVTGIASFVSCLLLILVGNNASLWSKFRILPFLGSYLALIIFFVLILYLKFRRFKFRRWRWVVNLGEYDDAFHVLDLLNQIRMNSIPAHREDATTEATSTNTSS